MLYRNTVDAALGNVNICVNPRRSDNWKSVIILSFPLSCPAFADNRKKDYRWQFIYFSSEQYVDATTQRQIPQSEELLSSSTVLNIKATKREA